VWHKVHPGLLPASSCRSSTPDQPTAHNDPLFSSTSAPLLPQSLTFPTRAKITGGEVPSWFPSPASWLPCLLASNGLLPPRRFVTSPPRLFVTSLRPYFVPAAPPITLLRPQPQIESTAYPTKPNTPPGVGVPTSQRSDVMMFQRSDVLSAYESTSCIMARANRNAINILCKNHRGGVGGPGPSDVPTLRPSDVLSALESHPYAMSRAKSHRMTSLRKNPGEGAPALLRYLVTSFLHFPASLLPCLLASHLCRRTISLLSTANFRFIDPSKIRHLSFLCTKGICRVRTHTVAKNGSSHSLSKGSAR
jgi:hypothetical protein